MPVNISRHKRGRKPASESRAAEIRAKLLAWKQTPDPQRISLRALAAEIGTSHQLLSFYLSRWDEWRPRESGRPITDAINRAIARMCRQAKARVKRGEKLSKPHLRLLHMLARKGIRGAEEALKIAENNLPAG